jgi:hypothetical protein
MNFTGKEQPQYPHFANMFLNVAGIASSETRKDRSVYGISWTLR